ncbi:MAG TPA: radical SAM protein [Verrucomicrobiota bacterium]|nr:radical SAM protein [Verrucomicrobiales bacterium]HRI16327.1 radical SAM protein [Verrucomicrobiota bacterium]
MVAASVPAIRSSWAVVQDHSRVFQDLTFVYPVISRRSRGLSIGINLNPDKRCNFDCVYCEVDRRTPGPAKSVNLDQLRDELRWLIRYSLEGGLATQPKFQEVPDLTKVIRDIAFSGDGEPTMIPNFDACVQLVVDTKRELGLAKAKLVLITDCAGLDKASVRAGLALMDADQGEIWCKLDAGTEAYYRLVNRSFVQFDRILKNITETARVRPIVIQSLFLRIHGATMPAAEVDAYCGRLNDIRALGGAIREVHAYTIARPTPEPWATKLTREELEQMAATIRAKTGLPVDVFE